jgi:NADH:ubiquinone oxidoreductase subunit
MTNVFDYLTAVSFSKEDLFKGNDRAEKEYKSFLVNRSLSYHADALHFANAMNEYSKIPNEWQFYFLLNTLTKKKRYSKWQKQKTSENLEYIMQYYGYSISKAADVVDLFTDEQINIIKQKLEKGGK